MREILIPTQSQRAIVQLARRALENFVLGLEREAGGSDDPYLRSREYGAFVSLHKREELRGCVGVCAPRASLYETIIEMTEAAAARDWRVEPVAKSELGEIRIDVSVLSPLFHAAEPLALEAGKHGLLIEQGAKRGVLLPQVASQYGWDIQTFLEQTCLKAGLSKQAWKARDIELSAFTALIIEERS